jgi:hypothetical protein
LCTGVPVTSIVNLVLINSKGYMHKVELTPASAPATSDGGRKVLGDSSAFGVKNFLAVSKAKSCIWRKRGQLDKGISMSVEERSLVAQPKFQFPTIKKFINRNNCMDLITKGRTTINDYLCINMEASKLLYHCRPQMKF